MFIFCLTLSMLLFWVASPRGLTEPRYRQLVRMYVRVQTATRTGNTSNLTSCVLSRLPCSLPFIIRAIFSKLSSSHSIYTAYPPARVDLTYVVNSSATLSILSVHLRFAVLRAVKVSVVIFWVVMPCRCVPTFRG